MSRQQNISNNRSLEKVNSNLQGWFWGVLDFSGGSKNKCMKSKIIKIRNGVWRCDWIAWQNLDEKLFLMNERSIWFLEMNSTPGEDAVKISEMITKNLEYYINLVDKAATEFETQILKESSMVHKMLSNSIIGWGTSHESQLMQKIHYFPILRNCHSFSFIQTSQQPSTWREDPLPAERLQLAESSDDG